MAETFDPHKDKFDLHQGATLRRNYQWLVDDIANDISDFVEIRSQFRWGYSDADPVFDLTEANGGIVRVSDNNGEFQLHITDELSTAVVPNSTCDPNVSKWPMVFDIEMVHSDGDVIRIIQGTAQFYREATR
ncbi:MAG TPA: hypothetical protein DDW52_03110 [Planctomycetaceae bacterium]|nr:hypothetical protein [Planctomycetaceae bacterium]